MSRLVARAASTTPQSIRSDTKRIHVSPHLRNHFIFGANTDVGKTVVSAGLVRASLKNSASLVHYIKPLQCGGSDQAFVEKHASNPNLRGQTLFAWETPASPHIASRREHLPKSDEQVLLALQTALVDISCQHATSTTWIETAGGVLSPSSASPLNQSPRHASTETWGWSTQADLYQPLLGLAPVVLVGDGRLGGISATLSAMESLILRGFYIMGIVLLETEHDNLTALREYASRKFKLRSGDGRALFSDSCASIISLPQIPPFPEPLHDWYESPQVSETFEGFDNFLGESWSEHVGELQEMRAAGRKSLWWPFTQHGNVENDSKITLIDSASGDNFQVVTGQKDSLVRETMFDACASWWTQGLGHGESSLALASAAAAGRYGHVIFPDVVHAPALALSQRLIGPKGPGYGWANRVFFTDDGSTAMEVSIKMGFKTFQKWHGLKDSDFAALTVCAQQDCYHGDTLGAMDVAEPSVFNQGQHPWYEPKGLFLPTPTLGFADGVLSITHESGGQGVHGHPFSSLYEAMDVESRLGSGLYHSYVASITRAWDDYESNQQHAKRTQIGSVVIEPVFMGAGGMKFVDPLWQRALMEIAKAKRVPIVFDEVASGLYRVGVRSCRDILKSDPDIGSYAKLLTGGLLPMSVTLASEDVFESFLGDEKGQALLHGHSYTAHPVGCVSAIQALDAYEKVFADEEGDASLFRQSFDIDEVIAMSHLPLVEKCFALGTVLAVTIKPDECGGTGYAAASRTTPIARHLRDHGVYARPLGNVIYIMASPVTSREECARVIRILKATLDSFGEKWPEHKAA